MSAVVVSLVAVVLIPEFGIKGWYWNFVKTPCPLLFPHSQCSGTSFLDIIADADEPWKPGWFLYHSRQCSSWENPSFEQNRDFSAQQVGLFLQPDPSGGKYDVWSGIT